MTESGGELGPAMRKTRAAHEGWTSQRVADAFGCSRSHISRVELGRVIPSRELVRFYDDTFQAHGHLLGAFDQEAKRSTSRAARLDAATTQRVNLRTTAEVLAWLAGVVAFALVCPLWLTIAVVAVALGAGTVRAAKRRTRAALIVLPVIVVVALAAYLLARHSPGQPASAAHEPRGQTWVSVGYGVQAAFEVKNLTFRKRWGTTIEADGYDDLLFRIFLRNFNPSTTPPLFVRLYISPTGEGGGGTRDIGLGFGLLGVANGRFMPGPHVNVIPQSNGLYKFHADPLRYGEPTRTNRYGEPTYTTPEVEVLSYPRPSPPEEENTGEEYPIPSLSAHSEMELSFNGSYNIPGSSQLSGGDVVEIKNPSGPDKRYVTTASAVPGDALFASGLLFNTGFRGANVRVRIHIGAEEHKTVSRIRLYASEDDGRYRELGSGTVNSGSGVPLRLSVQPGSTELVNVKNKCQKVKKEPLPDGIAEGGVDVGTVGGWLPRDPCHGDEFNRFILFKLNAR